MLNSTGNRKRWRTESTVARRIVLGQCFQRNNHLMRAAEDEIGYGLRMVAITCLHGSKACSAWGPSRQCRYRCLRLRPLSDQSPKQQSKESIHCWRNWKLCSATLRYFCASDPHGSSLSYWQPNWRRRPQDHALATSECHQQFLSLSLLRQVRQ